MSNNLKISSGGDFSKKIFSEAANLSHKPSLIHGGKIFSENIFSNTNILASIENSSYYTGHGLPNVDLIINYSISSSFSDDIAEGQSVIENFTTFNVLIGQTGSSRIESAMINAVGSSFSGASVSIADPYNNNPPPFCDVP